MLEFKATKHSYYCSDSNYYVNGFQNFGRYEYADWHDFKVDWIGNDAMELDDDYNHLFRFDIIESEDKPGEFELHLFFILQRKGIFRPVVIHRITKEDMPEIEAFLSQRWQYMKSQWYEFSKEQTMNNDLISRSALQAEFEWLKRNTGAYNHPALDEHIERINKAPAIDTEPVRHACWMYEISFEDESKRDDFDVTCTGCGALFGAESRDDAEIIIMGRWDYCPFCGAKMDLEGQHARDSL